MNEFEEMIAHAREAALSEEDDTVNWIHVTGTDPDGTAEPKETMTAASYRVVTIGRMVELCLAIKSTVRKENLTRDDMNPIKLWARELSEQADLLDTMLIYDT